MEGFTERQPVVAEGLSTTPKTFVSMEIILIIVTIEGNGLIFMFL